MRAQSEAAPLHQTNEQQIADPQRLQAGSARIQISNRQSVPSFLATLKAQRSS
jgi:hypothetical protein